MRFPFLLAGALGVLIACGCNLRQQPNDHEEQAPSADKDRDEIHLSADAIARAGITIEAVTKQTLLPTFIAPARVTFNEEAFAHVGTPVPGRVIKIPVRIGDVVAKNETLLIVESPELGHAQSDYLQKLTAITASEAAVSPLKLAYERGRSIHEKDQGISLAEVLKREAEFKVAQGQLETAKSALNSAEQKLISLGMSASAISSLAHSGQLYANQLVIAPINGTVVQREVTLGELVIPDKETLIVLADMSKLWIIADVPESKLRLVKKDARAWVKVSAATNEILEGKVTVISPSLDLSTRSVQVRIEVNVGEARLVPGMFAEVEIEYRDDKSSEPAVVVPENAIQTIAGNTVVFMPVEDEPGSFIKQPVKIGRDIAGKVPVLSGLQEGDKIVTAGSFILKAELGKGQVDDD